MSTYKVKASHDQALITLVDVNPQPSSIGIQSTRRTYSADGGVYDEARFVELEFSALASVTEYQSILTQFNLSASTATAPVTVYVRDETFAWVRMNGTAVRPEIGRDVRWSRYFPRDIKLLVRDLEAAA